MQHVASHARARVHGRQDEQRLEENGEVIPVADQLIHPRNSAEDLRHAHGQRDRAAGSSLQVFAHGMREVIQVDGMHSQLGEDLRRGVDGVVVARHHGAGGDQRHDAHQGFGHHGAIADEARVGFLVQHLRGRAGGDQRMEARDRSAGHGHKQKRKELAADDRAAAVDKAGRRRKLNRRMNDENTKNQSRNRAQLQIGREIAARRQQQPHRQNRGDEAIGHQQQRDLMRIEGQPAGTRRSGHKVPANQRGHQRRYAGNRSAPSRGSFRPAP